MVNIVNSLKLKWTLFVRLSSQPGTFFFLFPSAGRPRQHVEFNSQVSPYSPRQQPQGLAAQPPRLLTTSRSNSFLLHVPDQDSCEGVQVTQNCLSVACAEFARGNSLCSSVNTVNSKVQLEIIGSIRRIDPVSWHRWNLIIYWTFIKYHANCQ